MNRDLCLAIVAFVPVTTTAVHEHADVTINVVHAYLAELRTNICRWSALRHSWSTRTCLPMMMKRNAPVREG